MKTKTTLLFVASLICMSMVQVGNEIELDAYVNGRMNASNFSTSFKKNIQAVLPKGTRGIVKQITSPFKSGNFGVQLTVSDGPKKGKTFWVYYDKAKPAIKVIEDKKPESPKPELVKKDDNAVLLKDQKALRDPDELALEESIQTSKPVLDNSGKKDLVETPKGDCKPDQQQTQPPTPPTPPAPVPVEHAYTPEEAIKDINAGTLKFLGRDLFPGNDANRTCVYKSEKAYILYNNCMGNKSESPVMDIEIISIKGGIMSYYLEPFDDSKTPNSQKKRSDYIGDWRVTSSQTEAPGADFNLKQLKEWKAGLENKNNPACWVKEEGKTACYSTSIENPYWTDWSQKAQSFWKAPGDEWYAAQKKLRKAIIDSKF